jgi:hypothetical protein
MMGAMNEAEIRAEPVDPALRGFGRLSPRAEYGSICP